MQNNSTFSIQHSTFGSCALRLLFTLILIAASASAWEIPSSCKQLIVGKAKDWNSSYVTVTMYERSGKAWKPVTTSTTGRLGRNGLAWGLGVHPYQNKPYLKKEGDKRAPAGVFQIGGAYGAHPSIKKHRKLPYTQVTTRDLWVEDSTSPYYNQHLRIQHEPTTEWEKKAQMRQNDYPHSLKLYIGHNTATPNRKAKPYAGSAIFFHIWRNAGKSATAGCTTLPEPQLRELISKVVPNKNPLYVLLPQSEYAMRKAEWKLP